MFVITVHSKLFKPPDEPWHVLLYTIEFFMLPNFVHDNASHDHMNLNRSEWLIQDLRGIHGFHVTNELSSCAFKISFKKE